MRLFYDSHIKPGTKFHTLSEDESKHIVRVLRLKTGNKIGLLNGKGDFFECEIVEDLPKKCGLHVLSMEQEKPLDHSIHIALGPTKQMDRLEWFVEKATEIGITEITLIDCENGERGKIKTERLIRKAVSAMKQSHRKFLPIINGLTPFKTFVENNPNGLIAHCYDSEKGNFESSFQPKNCPILIGPEGDFTPNEIDFSIKNGYKTVTLGKNRLRTETAALYACMRAKLTIE